MAGMKKRMTMQNRQKSIAKTPQNTFKDLFMCILILVLKFDFFSAQVQYKFCTDFYVKIATFGFKFAYVKRNISLINRLDCKMRFKKVAY